MKRKLNNAASTAVKRSYQHQVVNNANQRAILDGLWEDLKKGVQSVFEMKPLDPTYELDLYTKVYNHCNTGFAKYDSARQDLCRGRVGEVILLAGSDIYVHLQRWVTDHIGTLVKEFDGKKDALIFYVEKYNNFNACTEKLNQIFEPLNRSFVQPQATSNIAWCGKVYEVNRLTMFLWRNNFFESLKLKVCNAALSLIAADRKDPQSEGDMENVAVLIRSLIKMGVDPSSKNGSAMEDDLTIYQKEFEEKLLQDTQTFYRDTASGFIRKNSKVDYMRKVEDYMVMEDARIDKLFHQSSKEKIFRVLRKVLIHDHLDLIHGEFRPLLESASGPDREDNLRCLYALITQLDTPDILTNMVKLYGENVTSIGRQELAKSVVQINSKGGAVVFVDKVVNHFSDHTRIIRDVFKNEQTFNNALYLGIRNILADNITAAGGSTSGRKSKSAEMMARYCDLRLRDKTLTEEVLEESFSKVAQLFQLLDDRDIFIKFTLQCMALRLTQWKSTSDDAESLFIQKLGCGDGNNDITKQLTSLFSDYQISRGLTTEFNALIQSRDTVFGFDFSVQVIRSSVWLFEKETPHMSLPAHLHLPLSEFQVFFSHKFSGRKLVWLPSRYSGEIRYFPPNNSTNVYTLEVSGYQIAILLLFETKESLTLEEIVAETSIDISIVKQVVGIFLRCKLFILKPEGVEAELELTTRVYLFLEFRNKKTRLSLNVPLMSETKQQELKMDKDIELLRKYALQALIVRLMKAKQQRLHRDIVMAVAEDAASANSTISFMPQPTAIKKAIDLLLEQQYIKRDDNQRELFHYIA